MPQKAHTEIRFEEAIEEFLLKSEAGYQKGDPQKFDIDKALFPEDTIAFIQTTQKKNWKAIESILGPSTAETIINDLCKTNHIF